MQPVDKITFSPIKLLNQHPTEIKDCYVELYENYLHYRIEFDADEPISSEDHSLGWEKVYNKFDTIAMKRSISGIEKSFTKDKKWGIYIIVSGFANDIKIYFRSEAPAISLFDKLQNWLISIP